MGENERRRSQANYSKLFYHPKIHLFFKIWSDRRKMDSYNRRKIWKWCPFLSNLLLHFLLLGETQFFWGLNYIYSIIYHILKNLTSILQKRKNPLSLLDLSRVAVLTKISSENLIDDLEIPGTEKMELKKLWIPWKNIFPLYFMKNTIDIWFLIWFFKYRLSENYLATLNLSLNESPKIIYRYP